MKDQDFTGVLHKNSNKLKNNSPDYSGSFIAQGQKHSLSCWFSSNHAGTDAGKGLLWTNTTKTSETQPDCLGWIISPLMVKYSLAGWKRQSEAGNTYLKLSVKVWDNQKVEIPEKVWGLACQIWKDKP